MKIVFSDNQNLNFLEEGFTDESISSVQKEVEFMRQKWNHWITNNRSRDSQIREGYQNMIFNVKQKFETEFALQENKFQREKEELLSSLEGNNFELFQNSYLNKIEEKESLQSKTTENLLQLASENMELKEKIQTLYSQLHQMSISHEQEILNLHRENQNIQVECAAKMTEQADEVKIQVENVNQYWEQQFQYYRAKSADDLQKLSEYWKVRKF